ncbi:MAG: M14 family metallopeptidase, partial [Flavobacteriaceae bacterium]
MKKILLSLLSLMLGLSGNAQLKSPSDFLGYELGTQFTRHHQVIDYVNHVAENSDFAQTTPYGKTNEDRTLQLVYLSAPENLAQLETMRQDHLRSIGYAEGAKETTKEFSIVWLSYNVHGNESTSTEAALKTLHTLVTEKQDWLENLIVIMDPCINPDGRDRYVNWYNQVKSTPFDSSPLANEHFEDWPGGRYNHYYFDLNRDWAWLSQKESQQRLPNYLAWMPQIHVDFHEQGVDSPYYFAPAVEPYHEVITDFQRDFQATIAKNHSRYFDKEGWLYFTDEVFDLLYPGYGDTYPMFNGAIGMTYEQGGSGRAGLSIRNSVGDLLSLKDRIAHHYTSGLSTVEVAHNNVMRLNKEFSAYHADNKGKYATYALEGPTDKMDALKRLLNAHQIPVKQLAQTTNIKGIDFASQKTKTSSFGTEAIVLNGNGKKSRLIQALFEPQTQFSDSLTYDITSWALPYAYGLKAVASNQNVKTKPLATST